MNSSLPQPDETFLAVLTPVGRAAVATLAVRGPSAWQIAGTLFQRTLPDEPELGGHWFGRFGEAGCGYDEVVLAIKQTKPFPWIEIHCHGGPQVVQFLCDILCRQGVRECAWQDFVERTTADALQAQAAIALARAATLRTATILLDQYHGAFAREIQRIVGELRNGRWMDAKTGLALLAQRASLGRHLTTPLRVVIAGAPNVGKSSLVNALVGYERSIVSPLPGTTRDLVTTAIAIDGWPIELVDTAGWRSEADPLEQEGIVRAQLAAGNADLCLWLVDGSTTPVFPQKTAQAMGARSASEGSDDASLAGASGSHFPSIDAQLAIIVNKIDLPAAWDYRETMSISAQTGQGLPELAKLISQCLAPNPPLPGDGVPFTPELCDVIEKANALVLPDMGEQVIALLEGVR